MFYNDKKALVTFFSVADTIQSGEVNDKAKVTLHVFANLVKIYGTSTQRMDEFLMNDFNDAVNTHFGFNVSLKSKGIDKVLSEFGATKDNVSFSTMDRHPLNCFSLTLDLVYQNRTNNKYLPITQIQ